MASVRRLTLEERYAIEALLKTDISLSEIARRINRSKNGVIREVGLNGGVANYNALKAQQSAVNRKAIGNQKAVEFNKTQQRPPLWKTRIENIEMQLEIITTTLQELLDGKNN